MVQDVRPGRIDRLDRSCAAYPDELGGRSAGGIHESPSPGQRELRCAARLQRNAASQRDRRTDDLRAIQVEGRREQRTIGGRVDEMTRRGEARHRGRDDLACLTAAEVDRENTTERR